MKMHWGHFVGVVVIVTIWIAIYKRVPALRTIIEGA